MADLDAVEVFALNIRDMLLAQRAEYPGANAITVVEQVLAKVDALRGTLLPADVELAEVSIELCDARPSMVEADLGYWLRRVGSTRG